MKLIRHILPACYLLLTLYSARAQSISYLIPDIGTPGMNTYIEIIGPHDANGNFGLDGLYLDNPGDAVQVICANPSDTQIVRFGPCAVSWNGRMLSLQAFVLPWATPSSWDWTITNLRIPIQVVVNGVRSNVDTFYVVQPQHLGLLTAPGDLGSGGVYGVRSRRGAMIVDSLMLEGGEYTVSTADCDPFTIGNQGFLPLTLISKARVSSSPGSLLTISADSEDGGAGGGGGGGAYSEDSLVASKEGGAGYTGGEGGVALGGDGTGLVDTNDRFGCSGLNGISGGFEKPGALAWYSTSKYDSGAGSQGTGGGTGMPFGASGQGGYTTPNSATNSTGGFGGASGAAEGTYGGFWTGFGGAGAGNATSGTSCSSGSGQVAGNNELVPVCGGSGGAGGNPYSGLAGSGGGGGGGVAIEGVLSVSGLHIEANGANGGGSTFQFPKYYSGAGGAGSGGGILLTSKTSLSGCALRVDGGQGGIPVMINGAAGLLQDGGDGGSGRTRLDGYSFGAQAILTPSASQYSGPSTDTSSVVWSNFTLSGSGNGSRIRIYLRPLLGAWRLDTTISGYSNNSWSAGLSLPFEDSVYLLAVAQEVINPNTSTYNAEPSWVLSQAGANILHVMTCASVAAHPSSGIASSVDTLEVDLGRYLKSTKSAHVYLSFNTDVLSLIGVQSGCTGQNDSIVVSTVSRKGIDFYIYRRDSAVTDSCTTVDVLVRAMVSADTATTIAVDSVITLGAYGTSTQSVCTSASFAVIPACGDPTLRNLLVGRPLFAIKSLYPNPTTNEITVQIERLDPNQLVYYEIEDVLGRILMSGVENQDAFVLKTHSVPSGLATLKLRVAETVCERTLLISH